MCCVCLGVCVYIIEEGLNLCLSMRGYSVCYCIHYDRYLV